MPKCILKLVVHEDIGTLFVRIVDFIMPDGTPVIHDTRMLRSDPVDVAMRVFDMATATGIVRFSDDSAYSVIGGAYATV